LRELRPESGLVPEKDKRGDIRQNRCEGGEGSGKNYSYMDIIFRCID